MIGTIIIAVLGYGASLMFAVASVGCLMVLGTTPRNDPRDRARSGTAIIAFFLAIVLAAATRAMTGGW